MGKCVKCGADAGFTFRLCNDCLKKSQSIQPIKLELIDCPACHKQVSNMAVNCPHCGHPFKIESRKTNFLLKIIILLIAIPGIILALKGCVDNQ